MKTLETSAEENATFKTIAQLLSTKFQVNQSLITPTTLLTDLGLDSLSLMEFVFAVEDAFHLRIPEDRLDPREAGIDLAKLSSVIDEFLKSSKNPN
jgi:acyl carrier protein